MKDGKRGEKNDDKASSAQYFHWQTTPTTGDLLVLVLSDTVKVPVNIHRNEENDVLKINPGKFSSIIPLEVCRGVFNIYIQYSLCIFEQACCFEIICNMFVSSCSVHLATEKVI